VTLTAPQRLYAIGAIILAALVSCSRSAVGTRSFLIALVIAGIAYLLAIWEFFRTRQFSRQVVFICIALAIVWRIPFLMLPPGSDDDIHRYVWDGRVQRLGYNPYQAIPADPTLAGLHTPETRGLNHPELPSPYPAGAELFFRAVATIHESVLAFKIAFLLCDFAIVALLFDMLRRNGQGTHWVLAYAWHPLLPLNVAGSGHIDIVGALLLLISVAALGRRWRRIAAIAFAFAVAIKFLPIVLTPLYWRRLRVSDGFLAAFVFALLYVPFLQYGRLPTGSLGTYVHSFRFNDPVFTVLERVTTPKLAVGLAVLGGFAIAVWLRRKSAGEPSGAFAWPMAVSLLCAPVIYPWYLLWLLPFLRSASTLPIIVWTVSILPTYYVWHLRAVGRPWLAPGWVMLLEYGSMAAAGAIVGFRWRIHRPTPSTPTK
jgi:alpha-1,6-mannosyltransferase